MKTLPLSAGLLAILVLAGCQSAPRSAADGAAPGETATKLAASPVLQKPFILEVLEHLYRWDFDQSYTLESGKLDTLEIWARPLHPRLDPDDRSDFAELWIPALKMRVELKRSDYTVPELGRDIVDHSFKIKRVTRQLQPPASRSDYEVAAYPVAEVRDHLFDHRAKRVAVSNELRIAARRLMGDYLKKTHPAPFTEDQLLYLAPLSPVSNDVWVLWETGRKVLHFSADMDLADPGIARLSQLRMEVIDLDKEVVASLREVPGSNAFVTKDWVGRLFFNCILHGERLVRTPADLNH